MFKTIFYTSLVVSFCLGLLWFFTGRVDLKPIQYTASQVSESNRKAQSIGNSIAARLDGISERATNISESSKSIKSGSEELVNSSRDSIEASRILSEGIESLNSRFDTSERRSRSIVSILGAFRKLNEEFREANTVSDQP